MEDLEAARRARKWLLAGVTGLVTGIALALGDSGWFAPTLAGLSAVVAGVGLHRLGRTGARAWPERASSPPPS